MQTKVEYVRVNHVIQAADGTTQIFKSISKAKQWSREWQQKNGGLGMGKLRLA